MWWGARCDRGTDVTGFQAAELAGLRSGSMNALLPLSVTGRAA